MTVMAKSKKPKLTVHVDAPDIDLLKEASREFPGVSEAFLVRAALRVALPMIADERQRLSTPPVSLDGEKLTTEEIKESQRRAEEAMKAAKAMKHAPSPKEGTSLVGNTGMGAKGSKKAKGR